MGTGEWINGVFELMQAGWDASIAYFQYNAGFYPGNCAPNTLPMSFLKLLKRRLYRRWSALWSDRLEHSTGRCIAWVDLMLFDFGLIRAPVNFPVEIAPGIWRSNQPTPGRLKRLARQGFLSVLSLRGEHSGSAYKLERYYCNALGLQLFNLPMASRRAPKTEEIKAVWQLFDEMPKPILLHCKSGADRAGLIAALAQLHNGVPVSEAKRQLSFRFLHIKLAATGVLDAFLDAYETAQRDRSIGFEQWLEEDYDRAALQASFQSQPFVSWFVDKVLRRE